MDATTLTLILSGISTLSTIAAFISCVLMYKSIRPRLKIKVINFIKKRPQCFYKTFNGRTFAFIRIHITNASSIQGSITDAVIKIKDKFYLVATKCSFNQCDVEANINIENLSLDAKKVIYYTPIDVLPFSHSNGFLYVPNLPAFTNNQIKIKVICCSVSRLFKYRKKITLFNMENKQ